MTSPHDREIICPCCKTALGLTIPPDGAEPVEGDVTVCAACGIPLMWVFVMTLEPLDDLSLREIGKEYPDLLDMVKEAQEARKRAMQ